MASALLPLPPSSVALILAHRWRGMSSGVALIGYIGIECMAQRGILAQLLLAIWQQRSSVSTPGLVSGK